MSLVYRQGSVTDFPAILELYAAAYGKTFSLDWLEWWNLRCPNGHNRLSVVEDAGRLVASYGLLPVRMWVNGHEVKGSLCTNVAVRPESQGQGIFTKLGRYALGSEAEHSTPLSVGMPNAKALPGHLKVGWEVPLMLTLLTRTKSSAAAHAHGCVQVGQYDERVDALVERIKYRYAFMVIRSAAYLNWRYSKPATDYTLYALEDGLHVLGYVVCKHYQDRSHIVDIHAESLAAFRELLDAAVDFAGGRQLTLWTNVNDPYRPWFMEAGFVEQATTDRIILHTNYGPEMQINRDAGWDFPLGVNDVV